MMAKGNEMHHCEQQDRAALYGMGLLDGPDSSSFEQHLGSCAVCAAEVRKGGDLAVQLTQAVPLTAPPAKLRDRVLREAVLPKGLLALARGRNLQWQPTDYAGVSIAHLFEDPIHGEIASLLRLAPGALYPSHHHTTTEHCYVIEGDLAFTDHTLNAGDYSAGAADSDHDTATTVNGCLLFLVYNQNNYVHAH